MNRMTVEEWPEKIDEILDGVKSIMKAKNQDYTAGSGDPFANFRGAESFGMEPLAGLCLRMDDKFQRVKAYFQNGELAVEGEGLEDSFKDIIGYSVLALGMLDELKGKDVAQPRHPYTLSEDVDLEWADFHARHAISKQHTPDNFTVTIRLPERGSGGIDKNVSEEESKPSWKDAPEWAAWLAQDKDGWWFWYDEEPVSDTGSNEWVCGSQYGKAKPVLHSGEENPRWLWTKKSRPVSSHTYLGGNCATT